MTRSIVENKPIIDSLGDENDAAVDSIEYFCEDWRLFEISDRRNTYLISNTRFNSLKHTSRTRF